MEKRKLSEETKKKIRLARLGKKWSEEVKEKIRKSKIGKTYEMMHGIEKANKLKEERRNLIIGKKNPFYGKTHNLEMRKLIGLKGKGRIPWNKGKIGVYSKETLKQMGSGPGKHLKGKNYDEIHGHEKAVEMRKKQSELAKIMLKDKSYGFGFPTDGTMKIKRAHQVMPIKDTKIEIKIQNYLKQLRLRFFTHQYRNEIKYGYQCDILIPIQKGVSQKTIIECDGDWWHGNTKIYDFRKLPLHIKEQIPLDFERTAQLEEAGFKVIRLWENEINILSLKDFKKSLIDESQLNNILEVNK